LRRGPAQLPQLSQACAAPMIVDHYYPPATLLAYS